MASGFSFQLLPNYPTASRNYRTASRNYQIASRNYQTTKLPNYPTIQL